MITTQPHSNRGRHVMVMQYLSICSNFRFKRGVLVSLYTTDTVFLQALQFCPARPSFSFPDSLTFPSYHICFLFFSARLFPFSFPGRLLLLKLFPKRLVYYKYRRQWTNERKCFVFGLGLVIIKLWRFVLQK